VAVNTVPKWAIVNGTTHTASMRLNMALKISSCRSSARATTLGAMIWLDVRVKVLAALYQSYDLCIQGL
jgi:hypothetical protein